MFTRFTFNISKFLNPRLTHFSSQSQATFTTLSSLFKQAESQLSSPSSYDSALNNLKQGIKLSSELFPSDFLQQSYWSIYASLLLGSKNPKESQEFLQRSVDLINQLETKENSENLCKVYKNIGKSYFFLKNYEKSEEFYTKSLQVAYSIQSQDLINLLECLIRIKVILNKDKEAVELSEQTLNIGKNTKIENEQLISILTCYGGSLSKLNQYEEAIKALKKTISLIMLRENEVNKDYLIAIVYEELINAFISCENEQEAAEATLEAGKVIERWFDKQKSLGFCEVMYRKFKNHEFLEPVVKYIVQLCDSTFSEAKENARAYNLAEEFYYRKGNLRAAQDYATKSFNLAKKLNDFELILKSCERLAKIYLGTKPELASKYIEIGKKILNSNPNKNIQKTFEYLQFQYYAIISDYKSADSCISTCLSLTPDSNLSADELINLHIDHSDLHYNHSEYEKSLKSLEKSLQILDENFSRTHPKSSQILSKIGSIYAEKNDYEKSIEYLAEALETEKKYSTINFSHYLAINTNLMRVYISTNQLNLALETGESVVKFIEDSKGDFNLQLGIFYLCFGDVNFMLMKKDEAKHWVLKAKEIFGKLGSEDFLKIANDCLLELAGNS